MPEAATLPPLKQAMAKSFETGQPIEMFKPEANTPPPEVKKEPEVEKKEEAAPFKEPEKKGLAGVNDDAPEPPKKEVKTEEPSDEPREGEKPAAFIKRLKEERAQLANEAKQLKEQLAKKPAGDPDEVKTLREKLAEREEALETNAYERSQHCMENYTGPINKAEKSAKDLIGKFTETKGVYERAKALDGRERLDFLKEHVDDAASTVFEKMQQVDELSAERDSTAKDRTERAKALADEQASSEDANVVRSFDERFHDVKKRLSIYREEGAEALCEHGRKLLTGKDVDPEEINDVVYMGLALPAYIEKLKAANAEVAKLKARIEEDSAHGGTIRARGGDGAAVDEGPFVNGKLKPLNQALKDGFKK